MAQITMSSVRVWVENRERATTNSASGNHKKKRGNDRLPNAARSRKKDDGRWTTILRGLSSSEQKNKCGAHAQNRPAESKKEKGTGISMSEAQLAQKSKANSRQDKNRANSRQEKNKKTREKPKAEREEHMKHTEDLHVQHKVQRGIDQEYIENREQEESRKSAEDGKIKVETEKKVSDAALKRLERDRKETGAAQVAQRELEE